MNKRGLGLVAALLFCCGFIVTDVHAGTKKPNIIFFLADDFSWNLVEYMPNLQAMQKAGMTFSNYFVTNSLCCPSRSTIFTGKFPHDDGVFTNDKKSGGGFEGFNTNGNEAKTFAVALHAGTYKTAMMGKYLNGYEPLQNYSNTHGQVSNPIVNPTVPTGWDEWDVAGWGYGQFGYYLNQNGNAAVFHDHKAADYLTDVLSGSASIFIEKNKAVPFFIEIATFAPHAPFTPANRDANKFPGLGVPRTPAFGARADANAPNWLKAIDPLDPVDIEKIDKSYRMRAQSVQAIDKMIGDILCQAATQEGMPPVTTCNLKGVQKAAIYLSKVGTNTYVFFSSDNGLHMGDYSLNPGKQTPYDIDIRVPLVVVGPGVKQNYNENKIAMNIDLCPTFTELGGVSQSLPDMDGHSLVPLFPGNPLPYAWRKVALIEHHGQKYDSDPNNPDPDVSPNKKENPPTYEALRTEKEMYVEYKDKTVEKAYYNINNDPYELNNIYSTLPYHKQKRLQDVLEANKNCQGATACWAAQCMDTY